MEQVIDFFTYVFTTAINRFSVPGFSLFGYMVCCLIVGCLLSIVFHNKG